MKSPGCTLIITGLAMVLVAACGGGGGEEVGGGAQPATNVPPPNTPPTASFAATPASGTAPLTVQLDASASSDPGGSIASYSWNFGDGSAAGSGVTATHLFQTPGSFTVTLTVKDGGGLTATTTRQVSAGTVPVSMPKIASIDSGDLTVCAVGVDGTAWCWGPNDYGQLGTGNTEMAKVPKAAAAGFKFSKISVSTGGAFACGITTTGKGYCWGSQEGGRLGDGSPASSGQFVTQPVPMSGGLTLIDVAAGGDHACALAAGGAAYCWGHNERGQLGTGNGTNSAVPVAVTGGLIFKSITTHQTISCGIAMDGSGWCWGFGAGYRLGNGSEVSSNVPVPVGGGLKFTSLNLGVWTVCGVDVTGDGYCWGSNYNGELGIGSKTPVEALAPTKVVGAHKWSMISPGVSVTCGVRTDGKGYCWGGNAWGERGTGPFPAADVTEPVEVEGGLTFQSVDADWVSCGVASQIAYCWGPGSEGSIGDGAGVDRGVPTKVSGS